MSSVDSQAPALTRGLKILELLAREEVELSFAAIKNALQIPAPSLWRLLNVLRESGYVIYDPARHTYRPGFMFLYMGNVLLHRIGFRSEAREHLKRLVELTGETAELSARVKDELVLLDQVESPDPVRLYSRIGSTYPYFHATAPGKVYLAHLSEEKLERVIDRIGLPSITEFTGTDLASLKEELKQIRADGYAVDNQEMRLGVFRIASPVFDQKGRIIACLGVAGPSFRLAKERERPMGMHVAQVAGELNREVAQR
jgi:DNA-binding IclR family transcriptional regulator